MKPAFLLFFVVCLAACDNDNSRPAEDVFEVPEAADISVYDQTEFVATLESKLDSGKNSIYSVSLLLAWNQFKNSFGYPLVVDGAKATPEFIQLCSSLSYKNALDSTDVETSWEEHDDGSVSVYAGFSILLPFEYDMQVIYDGIRFNGETVSAFGIEREDEQASGGVSVYYYGDDDHFVVALHPKENNHVIIIAKGIDMRGSFMDLLNHTRALIDSGDVQKSDPMRSWRCVFAADDTLRIPEFSFNIQKNWSEFVGQKFKDAHEEHTMVAAAQRTAFVLNNKGAIIESEAWMVADSIGIPGEEQHPKRLILDGPFFLYAIQRNSEFPYFAMKVENVELMVKPQR